jgi:hypothetical protein
VGNLRKIQVVGYLTNGRVVRNKEIILQKNKSIKINQKKG